MNIATLNKRLEGYQYVLASQSPRRKAILEDFGLPFTIEVREVEENFPEGLSPLETAIFLAEKKSQAFSAGDIQDKTLIITADTVVAKDGVILGKPSGEKEAREMLWMLSGDAHEVITGVHLKARNRKMHFGVSTKVFFKELSLQEIDYYLTQYQPFDKAGAYGIQEWIGYAGIKRIEGSYFNVVGLPMHELYEQLLKW